MSRFIFRGWVGALVLAAAGMGDGFAATPIPFQDGSLIDLMTVKGADAAASDNMQGPPAYNAAPALLHRSFAPLRFDNKFHACWWELKLPDTYKISKVRVVLQQVTSIAFTVKVATDESGGWDAVAPAATFKGPVPEIMPNTPGPGAITVDFPPVAGKFVRIDILGNNGAESGLPPKVLDNVLTLVGVQVWGPNTGLAITPAISAAQYAAAGGSATYHDSTFGGEQGANQVVDDGDPGQNGWPNSLGFNAPGSPATPPAQPVPTASIYVTLKNRMMVSSVAYASLTGDRPERPRDVKIYTSLLDRGDSDWTAQKEIKDVKGGDYVEIPFDEPAMAKRVRFEIERIWSPNVNPSNHLASGQMVQLYVYGDPLPPDFTYPVADNGGQVGIQIFDKGGQPVRTLQLPDTAAAGTYGVLWDGTDNLGAKLPTGDYECRVVLNPTIYSTMQPVGNTSTTRGQQWPVSVGKENPSAIDCVVADKDGNLYTANLWDEAAQDFRKWDKNTGQWLQDCTGAIRNGNPNAIPYAVAVDDKYVYCSTTAFAANGQAHVRRFTLADEKLAPWPAGPNITSGIILLHNNPYSEIPAGVPQLDRDIMGSPLKALASANGKLFVTDYLANKVWIFDRETGAPAGTIAVKGPEAIAVDTVGNVWVAHEHKKITAFSPDGKASVDVVDDANDIGSLCFGPGDLLYAADRGANKVLIYKADLTNQKATLLKTFGQPAQPGDQAPDHFYILRSVAVDAGGYITVAQNLNAAGSRLTRFDPDGKVVWDQVGGEFCTNGNYAQDAPDEVISQYFHDYKIDRKTGNFVFQGCEATTDPKYIYGQHSPMRIVNLNGTDFAFMGYGNSQQVYRKKGNTYSLCAMWGSSDMTPDGAFVDMMPLNQRPPFGLFSWHDTNGNGKIDPDEITWQIKPGQPVYNHGTMGISADAHGNSLYADLEGDIKEVPLTGFDKLGNPIYDLSKERTIIPRDSSPKPVLSAPRMVVRADDGSLYVDYQSQVYPAPPEAGGGWMTGWMLARYSFGGKLLWYVRLPETCTAMDYVPGGGVMLITMVMNDRGTPIYHYSADGMLLGAAYPSTKIMGFTASTDTTGGLSVSRDPRDGILDMFSEDCVGNRFRWQRADDHKKPSVISVWVHLTAPGQPLRVVDAPAKSS